MAYPVVDHTGKEIETISFDDALRVRSRPGALHQVVRSQAAAKRQGTASAKTRGEVRGGGAKPWRQKGLGRARAGSIRSPLWDGGGVVFGPKPRSYVKTLPKGVRRSALQDVLAARLQEKRVKLLATFGVDAPKTKALVKLLKDVGVGGAERVLCVTEARDEHLLLASRNVPTVSLRDAKSVSVLEVTAHHWLVATKGAFEILVERTRGKR